MKRVKALHACRVLSVLKVCVQGCGQEFKPVTHGTGLIPDQNTYCAIGPGHTSNDTNVGKAQNR